MASRRFAFIPFFVFVSALCLAEIRYTVQPVSDNTRLKVQLSFEAKSGPLELQMPNWAPGAYFFSSFGRNVQDFKLADSTGAEIKVEHPADNSWKCSLGAGGRVTVQYSIGSPIAAGAMHYSGPSTYMYVVGRKEEGCRLKLDIPQDWKVAVGLDAVGKSTNEYKAPNYDVLADNPVTMGDFVELHYTSLGKPITIAMRGAQKDNVDKEKIVRVCKLISDGEGDFFGGLPFTKYVWHFGVTPAQDGGGGLEHLSSTQISLAQGVGPRTVAVSAHEFFHLWNVKRIRSRVLGPFDYTQLPKTGALYWLEGVTDYYASLLLLRYGFYKEEDYFKDIISNTNSVRSNAARLEISPFESSMRVGEASNGRGNSSGWRISYYNLGWLVGLCLDLELRTRTNGKRSLDDVEHALWDLCKNDKPGFDEDEIRKQCVRFGGASFGDYFDRVVMKPGELPIEESLSKVGLKLAKEDQKYVDPGFDVAPNFGSPNARIVRVRVGAEAAGLKGDDIVLELNGTAITGTNGQEVMGKLNPAMAAIRLGDTVNIKIRRGGEEKAFNFVAVEATRPIYKVLEDGTNDSKKLALRKGWFFGGKK